MGNGRKRTGESTVLSAHMPGVVDVDGSPDVSRDVLEERNSLDQ
jgi:hypothetical protein